MSSIRSGFPRLPDPIRKRLAAARALARRRGVRLFLAGGAVRDLCLRRRVVDLDLVLEGDAPEFAATLAAELHAAAVAHPRFGTATLEMPDGGRLDLATSRREVYERPGALPRVEPAGIDEDLSRRDFTINAMALEIAPIRRPVLHDPFGGRRDLTRGLIRMLHARSPFDDPTRAFRAVRYGNRLRFRIEASTRKWIRDALRRGAFDAVSGDRLRREVARIFSEDRRAESVRRLADLGLHRAIDLRLRADRATLDRLRRAERMASRHPGRTGWFLYLLVWAADLSDEARTAISRRLALDRPGRRSLSAWPETRKRLKEGSAPGRASAEEILAAAACARGVGDRSRLERLLSEAPALTIRGRDLVDAGVPAGPSIGRALERTLFALRKGAISPGDELEFALAAARLGEP